MDCHRRVLGGMEETTVSGPVGQLLFDMEAIQPLDLPKLSEPSAKLTCNIRPVPLPLVHVDGTIDPFLFMSIQYLAVFADTSQQIAVYTKYDHS